MNKKVKWTLIGVVLVVLAIFLLYQSLSPISVEVVTVSQTAAKLWFLEDGEVAHIDDYQIYSTVAGKVLTVYIAKDDYVEEGQIIAAIDSKDYELEIEVRQRTIESYRVQKEEALSTTAASIEQARNDVVYYQEIAEKYEQLYQSGAVSKLEYDTQMQNYRTAASHLSQLQAKREASEYYESLIAIEEVAIKTLQEQIADCVITAEKSGYVTALPASSLSYVYPQTLLCTIKEAQEMVIESYVSTEDVVHLQIGDEVELVQKTRTDDLIYSGEIIAIADWAEESVSALGIIEKRVKVTILPLAEIVTASSGYDMDVRFFTFVSEACMVLPSSAFYRFDGVDYVFVVKGNGKNIGNITAVPVVKGAAENSEVVVISGIEVGDVVLKNATGEGIVEGAKVGWKF